ncbi:MAG TPA: aminoacyl-tRNA hydrolase, partial [Pirellulales bacterium]|nr:aminoacyl-tRNA hydrolase [Pirellulales bacterium]
MKLVICLGNPGRKYEGTRHNVGFAVAAALARRHASGGSKSAIQAEVIETNFGGEKVLLVLPQTFMNLSGASAVVARDFYKLANEDLLVVCDDFNIPLGTLRIRGQGSAGGQKGLADVINRLGTDAVPRLRIGVGPVPASWDPVDFVLGRFTKEEQPEIELSLVRAADAV